MKKSPKRKRKKRAKRENKERGGSTTILYTTLVLHV
jgi:hypothetical protein